MPADPGPGRGGTPAPDPAEEDRRLEELKARRAWELSAPRLGVGPVLSVLAVVAGGAVLVAGAMQPWIVIDGVTVAAWREGGPDGALAAGMIIIGVASVAVGVLALVLSIRRRSPRFFHAVLAVLAAGIAALLLNRQHILGDQVSLYNATPGLLGRAEMGPGITVGYVGCGLLLSAPVLLLRQALRALRS